MLQNNPFQKSNVSNSARNNSGNKYDKYGSAANKYEELSYRASNVSNNNNNGYLATSNVNPIPGFSMPKIAHEKDTGYEKSYNYDYLNEKKA